MKSLFLIILILTNVSLFGQAKGVKQVTNTTQSGADRSEVYAVVVGISDYQDPGIPDLRFADKDAEAFANYLSSDAGGKLDVDHLKVLLNEKATVAQFAIALDWLMEVVKENDQVIIYFSGHGDVEKKTITQPGYLLCWDAPARVYLAGGALALPMFQDIITTLSAQNKAKVIVVTDACRSGKLAGSSVGGSQITGANLAKQYSNEIKILSCQPNEYSIEGEQWGGGRGAFSYHLVDALYGMADNNNDLIVNLQEAGRYIEDHVSSEVSPVSQVPMVLGNRTDVLSKVNVEILAAIKSGKSSQTMMLSAIDTKGIEEDVLSMVDTSVRLTYRLFKQALKDKAFLEPVNACAETYLNQLIQEPKFERLHSTIKRNYAAALQDDAQQMLNRLLISDPTIYGLSVKLQTNRYELFPKYLERSAELLGEKHYLYYILKARMNFFKGYLLQLSNVNFNKNIGLRSIEYFNKAILFQADFPLPYWQLCNVYGRIFNKLDSSKYFAKRAMDLQPNWLLPYLSMAIIMYNSFKQFEAADQYFELANQIDSNSAVILNGIGVKYFEQKKYTKAEEYYKKAVLKAPLFVYPYRNLGDLYLESRRFIESEEMFKLALQLDPMNEYSISSLANLYLKTKQYTKSEIYYVEALKIDSNAINFQNLGFFYTKTKKYKQAEQYFIKAIQLDSSLAIAFSNLGYIQMETKRLNEAEQNFIKAIQLDPSLAIAFSNLGHIQKETNRFNEAEKNLKTAIQLDPNLAVAYLNLGWMQKYTKRFNEAEQNFKRAIELDPNSDNYNGLGSLYVANQKFNEAEMVLKKAFQLDSLHQSSINSLGYLYYITGRLKESLEFFQLSYKIDPTDNYVLNSLACLYGHLNQVEKAFTYLNLALEQGWNNIEQLENDDDLLLLRNQKEKWKALMEKYFPDKMKNEK
ncbi:MAG: tetratricopeptide repeat protein [Saprospiraceae bacterium]|nr:tetratricopeptide repeat protein [Saprospiraceae bacterium]